MEMQPPEVLHATVSHSSDRNLWVLALSLLGLFM